MLFSGNIKGICRAPLAKLYNGGVMRLFYGVLLLVGALGMSGCLVTKVATVPMRVTGAVISVVPVVGNPVDAAIDKAADAVDMVPF